MTIDEKKELKSAIEVLSNQMRPLRKRLNEIENDEIVETCKNLLGKCYAFPTGYNEDETWTSYQKIIEAKNRMLTVINCEELPDGRIKIETKFKTPNNFMGESVNGDYIDKCEIDPSEFEEHLAHYINEIRK